jgi:hypothetical protein
LKGIKLIQLFGTFSKQEFKDFEKFIDSPFFNNGRNYHNFLAELKKYYPEFESKNLNKEFIFSRLYPGKKFNNSLMNTIISRTTKMAEEFISYKSYLKKSITVKYDYINELMNRNLLAIAEKELKEYSRLVDLSEGISDELIKGRLDYEILNVQLNFKSDKQKESALPALNQTDYHIRFTIMRLAHFIHTLSVNKIIFNVDFDKSFINKYISAFNLKEIYEALINDEEHNGLNEITLIYVLWILGVTDIKNENHFYKMKEFVLKNLNRFHHHEKYNLFQALEAIAWILQQNLNREKFEIELLEVYKERIKHNVLSPDNTYMRIILFRAILIVSFYKPDWEFIEGFVEKCVPLLQPEQRENMLNYAMAHISYHRQKYDDALEFNNKINFELFAFRYDSRLLQFKIYYELRYFEEAHSLIDTHRHFISSNKTVSDYYKEMHSNFLYFYSVILKLKEGHKEISTGSLKQEISSTNNVLAKQWLIDKAVELEI